MLAQIADDVQVHVSEFMQSNAVVVAGAQGVLLIDPGITEDEIVELARSLPSPAVAGFSTHPHWDHLLWHPELGTAPRYGTALCAAMIQRRLSDPEWRSAVAPMLPPDIAGQVPLNDLFGHITGLDVSVVPWDGPEVQIIEHSAHAPGHAALLIPSAGVLVAGDMLSDLLIPILNFMADDPVADYLASLDLLEALTVEAFVPGHGSVGDAAEFAARIALDRAYLTAVRDGLTVDDPRLESDTMSGLHNRQVEHLSA